MIPYAGLIFVACIVALITCKCIWGTESRIYAWAFLVFGCVAAACLASIIGNAINVRCLL